jgi:teichuronic acid exporter
MVISENKKAIIWSGIDKVSTYIVNFTIQMILARLLCPEDYAVVAMLAIFFSISQSFIDGGFPTTLIQKQDCTQEDYSSVFFFNVIIGGVVYLLFFVCAPYIEAFYDFKGLAIVTKVYSLNLFINSFTMVHRVILTKKLQFKKMAVIAFSSSTISAIPAIVMAYCGFGYWALVIQSLVSAVITSFLLIYQSRWKPSFIFSKASLARLAPFGLRMVVIYLFHAIYNNIYSLLIGKKFTASELGYYDRGKTLSCMGSVGFSDFYNRALYPIQAKMQNDSNELESSYNRSFSVMCLAIVPISAFMFFFAEETVYSLFGPQWTQCTFILKILCLGYMFYPLQALNVNMLKVKGRGDYMLRSEVIKKVMGITCVLTLINFDLKWVVIGWTCCAIIEFLISEGFFLKLYGFSPKSSVKSLISFVGIAFILSCVLSYSVSLLFDNLFVRFIVGGCAYVLIYGLINLKKIKQLI